MTATDDDITAEVHAEAGELSSDPLARIGGTLQLVARGIQDLQARIEATRADLQRVADAQVAAEERRQLAWKALEGLASHKALQLALSTVLLSGSLALADAAGVLDLVVTWLWPVPAP